MAILCPFPQGVAAGQRLKYEQYLDRWRAAGWDIDVRPFMDQAMWSIAYQPGHLWAKALGSLRGLARRRHQIRDLDRFDLVYLFLWGSPIGSARIERTIRKRARRMIYDIEDNILGAEAPADQASVNPLLRRLRGQDKIRFLVASADHVIASSPELADRCRVINENRSATSISSSIDTDRFVPVNPYANDRIPVIGWTGTFSTRPYLDLLADVFRRLSAERRFKLRVIGNFDFAMPGVDVEVLRWSAEREVEQLQGIDIGVYPLPRDEWVAGKSGLKAIQYMAFGLPCVASRAGHTPNIIAHDDNGLLVDTDDEWLSALRRLIDEPDLRRRLGERARRDAVARYSLNAVGRDYSAVIDKVMQRVGAEAHAGR